jgi:hypothetical protein
VAVAELLRFALGCVLFWAAGAKVASRRLAWLSLAGVEAAVAALLVADIRWAPLAAGALFATFAFALALGLGRGLAGKRCGCFGARSRITRIALVRAAALSALSFALPSIPETRPPWLVVGVIASVALSAALAVAVIALAREVARLRLSFGPQLALSLEDEGPELGTRAPLAVDTPLTLAIFTSAGCPVCRTIEPALRIVASDPDLELRRFDEHVDAEVWRALRVPGSPYAVVLDADATVRAKGTFNTLPQLEAILAA